MTDRQRPHLPITMGFQLNILEGRTGQCQVHGRYPGLWYRLTY